MLLEEVAADLDRRRAVPCRRLGGAVLPLVGLGTDRGLPAPGVFAGQHAAPPAEVEPREVLAHDRRLRERIFGDLALEEFGREHVEGVGAGLQVPAEVRLRGAFGEDGRLLELRAHAVLRIGHVDAAGGIHAFGAVEVAERHALVVDARDLLGHFVLEVGALVDVAACGAEFAHVEDAADVAAPVGRGTGLEGAAPHAGEAVGRRGGVALVGEELAAELEHARTAALRVSGDHAVHGVLGDEERVHGAHFGDVPHQREVPREVEARIGDRRHVRASHADVRLERVEAGGDAGGADLVEHRFHVLLAVGVVFVPGVVAEDRVAARFEEGGEENEHQPEAAAPGERDVVVHVLGVDRARPVDRGVQQRVAAARHAVGEPQTPLAAFHRREEALLAGAGHNRRLAAAQAPSPGEVGTEDPEAVADLVVNVRERLGGDHGHRRLVVPGDVEPVAEVGAVLHRQLYHAEVRDRRHVHHQPAVLLLVDGVADEVHKLEDGIAVRLHHLDHRLVGREVEAHDQPVALAPEAVRLVGGALVGMRELDFVVEGARLRGAEKRDAFPLVERLLAGGLHDERPGDGVVAHREGEGGGFDGDVGRRGQCRERRRERCDVRKVHVKGSCRAWPKGFHSAVRRTVCQKSRGSGRKTTKIFENNKNRDNGAPNAF